MTIYLDNMAATPIDPRVSQMHREAMATYPGNAHSAEHDTGKSAQRAIETAGDSLLRSMRSDSEEITFTPGASAALWLVVEDAIARAADRPAQIAATAVEHPALLSALSRAERSRRVRLSIIPVDASALPRLDVIEAVVQKGIDLICTMAANNEIGTVTDLSAIAGIVAASGARHFVDASQAAGRTDMAHAASADLVVVSGAKMYGPRRAAALLGSLSREARDLAHDVFGSPDVASAIALAGALTLRVAESTTDEPRLESMRDRLQSHLRATVPGLRVNGLDAVRLAGSLHVSTPHLPGDAAVLELQRRVLTDLGRVGLAVAPAMGITARSTVIVRRQGLDPLEVKLPNEDAASCAVIPKRGATDKARIIYHRSFAESLLDALLALPEEELSTEGSTAVGGLRQWKAQINFIEKLCRDGQFDGEQAFGILTTLQSAQTKNAAPWCQILVRHEEYAAQDDDEETMEGDAPQQPKSGPLAEAATQSKSAEPLG